MDPTRSLDAQETLLLAHSPAFKPRLIERSITEVEQGQTRPVLRILLDELPDREALRRFDRAVKRLAKKYRNIKRDLR